LLKNIYLELNKSSAEVSNLIKDIHFPPAFGVGVGATTGGHGGRDPVSGAA
jgi:hypothetical protein